MLFFGSTIKQGKEHKFIMGFKNTKILFVFKPNIFFVANRTFLNTLFLFFLIGFSGNFVFAQKETIAPGGDWETDATWTTGITANAPGITNLPTEDESYNIIGYVTVGTDFVSRDLAFKANKDQFTMTITDTLVIYGSVDFNNDAMTVDILGGGLLIIMGNLSMGNKLVMDSDGTVIVKGEFNKTGSSAVYTGSGDFYADSYTGEAGAFASSGTGSVYFVDPDLATNLPVINDFLNNNGSTPLPVELLYFNVQATQNQVVLNWSTASELNNDYFTLEKSNNGRDFVKLGEVAGNGTTNLQVDYSFADPSPYLGLSYYRLSQTDYDGTTEVFPVVSVLFEGNKSFSVGPNPLSGSSIKLKINEMGNNEQLELSIVDLQGRLVETKQFKTDGFGNVDTDIQLKKPLQKGTYIFEIASKRSREYLKVAAE